MERRVWLKRAGVLALAGVASPWALQLAQAGTAVGGGDMQPPPDLFDAKLVDEMQFWLQPRTVDMVRPQTGERVQLTYWKDGHMDVGAYEELCHLLRDVQAGQHKRMDTRLIDTLWAAQAFVRRYGFKAPVVITSGYRSPATNRNLIERGLPAARNSLHIRGQAADFRLPGLHPSIVGELVQGFRAGGVGFYFRAGQGGGWIHADTGPEREWRG